MRDPERIPKVLKQIEDLWKRFPDLRLGQLIVNILDGPALYYLEDEDVIKNLYEFYKYM